MDTQNWICSCLGIDATVVDEIMDEFDLDIDEFETRDCIRQSTNEDKWGAARALLVLLLEKIIGLYPELKAENFDYDFESPSYPVFYYAGEVFTTKEELDAIAEREG